MPKGVSLHIGLNAVDPNHYDGWSGPLVACVNDALDMEALARTQGFQTTTLLDADATRTAVLDALDQAVATLGEGDILLVTYSGHGAQSPDWNGDEADGLDETWCLHDAQLIDDELWNRWVSAASGVRIVVVSDSCHSGTVLKARDDGSSIPPPGAKSIPRPLAGRVYRKNRSFYDEILSKPAADVAQLRSSVLLLSGCQDDEYSYDGIGNGQFTGALLRTWANGDFQGDYRRFHKRIKELIQTRQTPNFYPLGANTGALVAETPFTI